MERKMVTTVVSLGLSPKNLTLRGPSYNNHLRGDSHAMDRSRGPGVCMIIIYWDR